MKNKMIIIYFLIMAFYHKAHGRVYNYKQDPDTGMCIYEGYIPGGKQVGIRPIQAPTAKLETGILYEITTANGNAKGVATIQTSLFIFENIAPALGPCLGIFGTAFDVMADYSAPTPEDILNAVNDAIEKLTEEVNERFDDMKHYVDQELLDVLRDRINVEYKHMIQLFANCLEEVDVGIEDVVDCQEDANRYIRSGFGKFLLFKNELAKFTETSPPTVEQVKKMEVSFLPFREYATLNLMQLQVLKETYRMDKSLEKRDQKYKKYLKQLSGDAEKLINYAKDMNKWILFMHDTYTRKLCDETKKFWDKCSAEGSWLGNTYCVAECDCQFDITNPTSENCKKRFVVRADHKFPYPMNYDAGETYWREHELAKDFASKNLSESAVLYLDQQAQDIKNYWESEVLLSLPTWQGMKDEADNELSSLNDDISMEYSLEPSQYFSEKIADDIPTRHAKPFTPLQKYEEVRKHMMLLEDMHVSERFKKRYLRAYDSMNYFAYRARSKKSRNGYKI